MQQQPNILFFMTDQQRGDSINNSDYIMPNLNKLAESGVNFSETYCTAPHCCPSRASFFSGEYPTKHGVWHNVHVSNAISRGLNNGVDLWSEHLKKSNYNLFYSGKWHVDYHHDPKDYGWEELFVVGRANSSEMKRSWDMYKQDYDKGKLSSDSTTIREESEIKRIGYPKFKLNYLSEKPYNDDKTVDLAINKLDELKDDQEPWCMYIGTVGPHDSYQPPQRFLDMYKDKTVNLPASYTDDLTDKPNLYKRTRSMFDKLTDEEKIEAICHYRAFCTYEDDLFGKVMKTLEKNNQVDNTIIVFLSDHGDYAGEHGLFAKGLPNFKGAYHIPLIISWKNGIVNPNRIEKSFVSITDIYNTVLEMAHIPTNDSKNSYSLVPYLQNKQPDNFRDAIYTQTNGNELYGIQRSVMTRKWKLTYNGFDEDELYDLQKDPNETVNLAKDVQYKDTIRALYKKLWTFAYENDENCINPYIMVGLAEYGPGEVFNDTIKTGDL